MFKQLLAGFLAFVTAASMAAVDVNKATVADLDSIKGIGPGTSAKIIEAREKAPFKNWDDLINRVNGMGEKRAAKLSGEGLTVQGEAFKSTGKTDKAEKGEKSDKGEKKDKKEMKEKAAPSTSAKTIPEDKKPAKP